MHLMNEKFMLENGVHWAVFCMCLFSARARDLTYRGNFPVTICSIFIYKAPRLSFKKKERETKRSRDLFLCKIWCMLKMSIVQAYTDIKKEEKKNWRMSHPFSILKIYAYHRFQSKIVRLAQVNRIERMTKNTND